MCVSDTRIKTFIVLFSVKRIKSFVINLCTNGLIAGILYDVMESSNLNVHEHKDYI